MKFLLKVLVFSLILLSISSVYAIQEPQNIQASDINETSLTLSWDPVSTAFGYHIYYSSTQDVEILSAQKKEYVIDMSQVIEGLNSETQYYFIISAFNDEWEESIFSEEVSFTTTWPVESEIDLNASQDFKLWSIEVLAQNQIIVEFTAPLENIEGTQREFKVVEKDNELNIFYIDNSIVDPEDGTKIIVTFEGNLPVSTEFTLTVIDILDVNGRNIESWIESFENFYIDESLLGVIFEEQTGPIDVQNNNEVDVINEQGNEWDIRQEWNNKVDSIIIEWNNVNTQNQLTWENTQSNTWNQVWDEETVQINSVTGQIMDSNEVSIDMNSAWADADELPVTWPEQFFIIILAMLFGFMLLMLKFKKS